MANEGVWWVLKRGLAALRIEDRDRLDLHSFRRAAITEAFRNGTAAPVVQRPFAHRKLAQSVE